MARRKKKYDIAIYIDYFGDELDVVIKTGGITYIYPMDEAQHILDRLEPYQDDGVTIEDRTKTTLYTQPEEYTVEEYDEMFGKGDMWGFRWF